MRDFSRPKYFSPFEAADYGIIDQVRSHADTVTNTTSGWLSAGLEHQRGLWVRGMVLRGWGFQVQGLECAQEDGVIL